MVNFRGTCDLPPFLSQTTASVNKEGERKMYRGRFSGGVLLFFVSTISGRLMHSSAKMSSHGIDLRNLKS